MPPAAFVPAQEGRQAVPLRDRCPCTEKPIGRARAQAVAPRAHHGRGSEEQTQHPHGTYDDEHEQRKSAPAVPTKPPHCALPIPAHIAQSETYHVEDVTQHIPTGTPLSVLA